MGQPAYLPPPEAAAAEQAAAETAAQQTTRLVLIQGGKSAAQGGAAVAEGAAAGEGFLAAALDVVAAPLAFLAVLLWPSEIGPEWPNGRPPMASTPPQAPPKSPVQACPVPTPATEPLKYPNQTCPNDVLAKLQAEKDALVKQTPKRSPLDTGNPKKAAKLPCSYVRQRLEHMEKIKAKRKEMQDVCFGGQPDPGHKEQLDNVDNAIETYTNLKKTNCAAGHPMEKL